VLRRGARSPATTHAASSRRPSSTGQRLTDEEIFAFLAPLSAGGRETTYRSSSNSVRLLTNPISSTALPRRSLAHAPRALERGLRWEAPLTGIARTATRDVVVDGVHVPAGAVVGVSLGVRQSTIRRAGTIPSASTSSASRSSTWRSLRPAHLPRHAPGAHGDRASAGRRPRPAAEPAPRSGRRRTCT
jgi:hypothetical protein